MVYSLECGHHVLQEDGAIGFVRSSRKGTVLSLSSIGSLVLWSLCIGFRMYLDVTNTVFAECGSITSTGRGSLEGEGGAPWWGTVGLPGRGGRGVILR